MTARDLFGFPMLLAQHEAAYDRAIAEDAAFARRRAVTEAIAGLTRAEDCPRRGYIRDQCLACAADALRRAGLPWHAAVAEEAVGSIGGGGSSDVARLRDDLIAIERTLP